MITDGFSYYIINSCILFKRDFRYRHAWGGDPTSRFWLYLGSSTSWAGLLGLPGYVGSRENEGRSRGSLALRRMGHHVEPVDPRLRRSGFRDFCQGVGRRGERPAGRA